MKLFPVQLHKPSLPLDFDQPVREIDIKAAWNGDTNTALDVEILYQFNLPAYTQLNLFEYNHHAVKDFSIEYIDGHVRKSITAQKPQYEIDSALRSSEYSSCPSFSLPPSPSPSSIADLPWTHVDHNISTEYSHSRKVSSVYDDDPFIMSSPGACKMLGIPFPDSGYASPCPEDMFPLSPTPSSIADLPWSSPVVSAASISESGSLTEDFEDCSSTISDVFDVSSSHIAIHNDSSSLKHIRLLLRASILLVPAASGLGHVFTVPGPSQFGGSGVFTVNFTSPSAMADWSFLDSEYTPTPFTNLTQSYVFNAGEGYSLRLLRPEHLPLPLQLSKSGDDDDSLLTFSDIVVADSSPLPLPAFTTSSCPFLRLRLAIFTLLLTATSLLLSAFTTLLSTLPRRRRSYIKTLVLLWIFCRAFRHETTTALESRVWETAVNLFSGASSATPARPAPLIAGIACEVMEEVVCEVIREVVNGPVTVRDWIDYYLGWRGLDGSWV